MKILYLHQYFNTPQMVGGTRSYEMARRMVAAGHEVHMLTSSREEDGQGREHWSSEIIDGINVYWLQVPYDNHLGYLGRIWAFVKFAFMTSVKTNKIDADIVFATSTPLTIAIPGVFAKKRKRIPMVFEVRDLWPELPIAIGALKSPLAIKAARALETWAYRHSAAVVGLSPGMCEGVIAAGVSPEVVHNIPNSSDLELFRVSAECGSEFRASHDWLQDRPLVVYAGTLGRLNGVAYLARVAHKMLELNPEVRFLVVGGGYDEESIREEAISLGVYERNFFMLPSQPKDKIPAIYSAATMVTSLFVPIPEMWANSANKFFDGLAAGKPIAINYGGWQADLLADHQAGIVLSPDDVSNAAEKLRDCLGDGEVLQAMSINASSMAVEQFARDKLAAKLIDVLEGVKGLSDGR